jgi:hypothetical protein
VLAVIMLGSIAALNVAAIFTLRATPEPLLGGMVELTVGPGAGVELPHAANTKVITRALHRPVLRRMSMSCSSGTRPNCGRGNALTT